MHLTSPKTVKDNNIIKTVAPLSQQGFIFLTIHSAPPNKSTPMSREDGCAVLEKYSRASTLGFVPMRMLVKRDSIILVDRFRWKPTTLPANGVETSRGNLCNMPRANIIGLHPLTHCSLNDRAGWCTSPTLVRSRATFRTCTVHQSVWFYGKRLQQHPPSAPTAIPFTLRDLLHPRSRLLLMQLYSADGIIEDSFMSTNCSWLYLLITRGMI